MWDIENKMLQSQRREWLPVVGGEGSFLGWGNNLKLAYNDGWATLKTTKKSMNS